MLFARRSLLGFLVAALAAGLAHADSPNTAAVIRTPKPPAAPRISGPRVYGERPGRPFLFSIPVTGERPIVYSADGLPEGLSLDGKTGRITGSVARPGEYRVSLAASNSIGRHTERLVIKIGEQICLTPPMGWNSWNCFGGEGGSAENGCAGRCDGFKRAGPARLDIHQHRRRLARPPRRTGSRASAEREIPRH